MRCMVNLTIMWRQAASSGNLVRHGAMQSVSVDFEGNGCPEQCHTSDFIFPLARARRAEMRSQVPVQLQPARI